MADLANATKFYINGEWVEPLGQDRLDVINPATEQPINQIAMGNAEDADRAVQAAAKAFESFSQTSKEERIDLLQRIIASYQKFMPAIAEAVSDEMGAPTGLANAAQAPSGLGHLMTTLAVLKDYEFEEDLGSARIVREPAGVCGFITPWNLSLIHI